MTPFQAQVYELLSEIPEGTVTTYGDIAKAMHTNAVRAIGTAVGKNPNAPEVPCHRVVPRSGKIGNYSGEGGVIRKIALLQGEGVLVVNGKIVNFEQIRFLFKSS